MARADWNVGLVWLPKALRYNPPQSPNAVKAWAKAWDELPDCELKSMIRQQTEAFLKAFDQTSGKGFLKAFMEAFPHTEAEADSKTEAGDHPPLPSAEIFDPLPVRNGASRKPSTQEIFASWFEQLRKEQLNGEWTEDQQLSAKRLNTELKWLSGYNEAAIRDAVALYLKDPKRRDQDPPYSLLWFSKDRAVYLSKAKRGTL